MVSEVKVQMLLKLIEAGRINIEDIKNEEYKEEVKRRIDNSQ